MQADFTGLAIVRPHRSSPDRVRQCTPKVSGALSTDQSRSEVEGGVLALAMSLLLAQQPGWVRSRRPWLLGSQQRSRARDVCRRPLGHLDP